MSSQFDAPEEQIPGFGSDTHHNFWTGLEEIFAKYPHSTKHILGHWPVYTRRILIARFLAHWEIYKKVADLPGSILELGLSRGVSLFSFHKFLEITHPADTGRRVYGIDSFEGLIDFGEEDGNVPPDAAVGRFIGGWSAASAEDEIASLVTLFNNDNILARERLRIVKGRVQDVLVPFMQEHPGLRLSLIHFDMDLYEPTKYALEALWDLIVPGGVLVFDQYAVRPWEGETLAVDEFIRERGLSVRLQKLPWSTSPGAFFTKG